MPITMQFLGTGNLFARSNFHSNALLTDENGNNLLIDCGSDIKRSAMSVVDLNKIGDIYISHLHDDHSGGLEALGFMTYFTPGVQPPTLHLHQRLAGPLWNNVLSGGMESLEGIEADLETYFTVDKINDKRMYFIWSGIKFQLVQTVHIMNGFQIVHSYGLMFNIGEKTIFFTSDTQFNPNQIVKFYDMADLIFQDCETSPFKSGVHAHYKDLATLPEETRSKMLLYHYADGDKPDAVGDGFLGFVAPLQKYTFERKGE